jgi:hypothetical protein
MSEWPSFFSAWRSWSGSAILPLGWRSLKLLSRFFHNILFSSAAQHARWSQDAQLRTLFKGLKAHGKPSAQRGAICGSLLQQLFDFVGDPIYRLGFRIIYDLLLRHHEAVALTGADFVPVDQSSVALLRLPVSKGFNMSVGQISESYSGDPTPHFVNAQEVESWLGCLAKHRGMDLLLSRWDKDVANRYIKDCACHQGWDSKLVWSVHSLRHGKAVQLQAEGKDMSEIMLRGRWSSEDVAKGYAALPVFRSDEKATTVSSPRSLSKPVAKRQREEGLDSLGEHIGSVSSQFILLL